MRGYLQQRGKGSWRLAVYLGRDERTGARRYVRRTFRGNKRDARAALGELVTEVEIGRYWPSGTVAMRVVLAEWLRTKGPDLSPSTLREYRRIVAHKLEPAFGERAVSKITTKEIEGFITALRSDGLSASSTRQIHIVLRQAFAQARRHGLIIRNPMEDVPGPAVHSQEITPPRPEQVRALLQRAMSLEGDLAIIVRFMITTGCRRSEACGVRWSDLDLDVGEVRIARAIAVGSGGWSVKQTNTYRARVLVLDEETTEALREYEAVARALAAEHEASLDSDAYVFSPVVDGSKPWSPDTITRRFETLCKEAGVSMRLHDLRHYSATVQLAAGVPPRDVAGRHGWASLSMLDRYGHYIRARDREAAEAVAVTLRDEPPLGHAGGVGRGATENREIPLLPYRLDNNTIITVTKAAWSVEFHPAFGSWANKLGQADSEALLAAIRVLRSEGPTLGRPLVDTVKGSRHANMKELRPGSTGRTEVRVLFAFDRQRKGILLVGGDKSKDWADWYKTNIPIADARFDEHQAKLSAATKKATNGNQKRRGRR